MEAPYIIPPMESSASIECRGGEPVPENLRSSFSCATAPAGDNVTPGNEQIQMPLHTSMRRAERESESPSSSPYEPAQKVKRVGETGHRQECSSENVPIKNESFDPTRLSEAESKDGTTTTASDEASNVPIKFEDGVLDRDGSATNSISTDGSRGVGSTGGGFDQPAGNAKTVCKELESYANSVVKTESESRNEDATRQEGQSEEPKKKRRSKWDVTGPSDDTHASGSDNSSIPIQKMGFSDAPSLNVGGTGTVKPEDNALAAVVSTAIASAQQKHGLLGTEARRASRVQVGNLPLGLNESEIMMFFNAALVSLAGGQLAATDTSKLPVTCTEMFNAANRTCVLQFITQSEAQTCLTLNGIAYNGSPLTISPIPDYMEIEGTAEEDYRIFIQNLALDMTEPQIHSLLTQFGEVKKIELAKDSSGLSKGVAIVEYEDPAVTDVAIQALNGFTVGNRVVLVRRASAVGINLLAPGSVPIQRSTCVSQLPTSMSHRIFSNSIVAHQVRRARKYGEQHSPVVQLINCVFREDLLDKSTYDTIIEDIRSEASKFGALEEIVIPRPADDLSLTPGVGKVFLRYNDVTAARRAQLELNGRKFERRSVCASFYPLDRFKAGTYTFLSKT
eukprot:Selendium_serpulae@DN3848_c0_g1_i2.p1